MSRKKKNTFYIFAWQILVMSPGKTKTKHKPTPHKLIQSIYSTICNVRWVLAFLFVSCIRRTLAGKVLQRLLHCYYFNNKFTFLQQRLMTDYPPMLAENS